MAICGRYMFEFSVRKNMKNKITMIKKENSNVSSRIISSVEQSRVVTILNTIKH